MSQHGPQKPDSIENKGGWRWEGLSGTTWGPAVSQSFPFLCSDRSLWEEGLGHRTVALLTNLIILESDFNLKNHLNMAKNYLPTAKQRSMFIGQTLSPPP